jgi:hypothetical protein
MSFKITSHTLSITCITWGTLPAIWQLLYHHFLFAISPFIIPLIANFELPYRHCLDCHIAICELPYHPLHPSSWSPGKCVEVITWAATITDDTCWPCEVIEEAACCVPARQLLR